MSMVVQVVVLLGALSLPGDAFVVSMRIDAVALQPGKTYDIVVDVQVANGVSTSDAGVPAPVVQIKAPSSTRLVGTVLDTREKLSRNEFLMAPFELLAKEFPMRIPFELRENPGDDEHFSLNLLAFVRHENDDYFVRRRLELPLRPGASATLVEPTASDWGDSSVLTLGEPADSFSLPKADGTRVSLEQYRGKKNVVVTTYRAFW